MRFIKIGNAYYNLEKISKISFEKIENGKIKIFHIIINDEKISVDENEFRNVIDIFVMLVGEENIYE